MGRAVKAYGDLSWTQYSMGNLLMQVDADPTVAPEPASTVLLAAGALTLLLRRQRPA